MTWNVKPLLFALGSLCFINDVSLAATKSFYIGRGDLFRHDGGPNSIGILLSAGGSNTVIFSFALPGNYKKNSPVTIRYFFVSDGFPCNLEVQPEAVVRSRPGFVVSQLFGTSSGLSKASNDPISSPGPQTSFAVDYKLRAPTTGAFANSQKAGDRLTVKLNRDGVSDGCGNALGIEDVLIRYTTQ